MHSFFVSTGIVALAEMGDKTQLLALLLVTQFRRPAPIILGIFVATVINHTLAGVVGAWITNHVDPGVLRWILGLSFVGMAIWALIPDTLESEPKSMHHLGVFGATVGAFFLAEMGDKTQIATVALAAKYGALLPVVAGTTLGMMLADVPPVLFGEWLVRRIPQRTVRVVAALIFLVMGVAVLAT